ncbi:hypothetical protein Tco_0981327 [Tanacetum coccineum]
MFHVSNLKKCYSHDPLVVPLEGLQVDDKIHFVKEPVEIMDREVKQLRQSRVPIVKVRWNSRRGPEFTWEREDQFRKKYPHLFTKTAPSSRPTSGIRATKGTLHKIEHRSKPFIPPNQIIMSANDDFSLHDDEELSLHDDASLNGSVPASNKGDAVAKPPQIITTNTLSNIKLPVLQKDDYDTWAMEMEHYLEYIDNEVWKVIQNGNSKKRVTKGCSKRSSLTFSWQWMIAKESGQHQNTVGVVMLESKKMQKAVLKQQFEAFTISSKESLEKGYDRFQKLLSQLDALGAGVSDEDANHKFLSKQQTATPGLAWILNWQFVDCLIGLRSYTRDRQTPRVDGKMHVALIKEKLMFQLPQYGHFARECKFNRSMEGTQAGSMGNGSEFQASANEKEDLDDH